MFIFCINPLSANKQCLDSEQIYRVVSNLVACFEYLLPALKKGRAKLIYDSGIEQRHLRAGEHFSASINCLPRDSDGADIKRLWFTYTKNRAEEPPSEELIRVVVYSRPVKSLQIVGEINEALFQGSSGWLSLGGNQLNESRQLYVETDNKNTYEFRNAHHLNSIRDLLPYYQPSPKHHHTPYIDSEGRKVSAMPLREDEAQHLLLASLEIDADRWAYHEVRCTCYCFKLTQGNIYHGYEMEEDEVPTHIRNRLSAEGMAPAKGPSSQQHV